MRYGEGPTAHAEVVADAPLDRVWELVTDIKPARAVLERVRGATWIDDGPAIGSAVRWSQLAQGHGRVADGIDRSASSRRLMANMQSTSSNRRSDWASTRCGCPSSGPETP
jgi:hypothetical protein